MKQTGNILVITALALQLITISLMTRIQLVHHQIHLMTALCIEPKNPSSTNEGRDKHATSTKQ